MIDAAVLAQVRRLQIRTRRLVTEVFAGGYASTFRGAGIEVEEVREFAEGDDPRSVDWNVTARTGRPFVKKYVEERELTLLLLVDTSLSLRFGSQRRSPRQAAAETCACLAFAALGSHDKVGLLCWGRGPELYIPARKGATHGLRVVREVLAFPAAARGGDLAAGVEFLGRVLRRRAVVFLLSDFHVDLASLEVPLKRLCRRHDVVGGHLLDPRELALPPAGLVELEDVETGRRLVVDSGDGRLRREWAEAGERRVGATAAMLRRAGADWMPVRLDEPATAPLLRLFRERERRRGR